jgi:hypothetical protein
MAVCGTGAAIGNASDRVSMVLAQANNVVE